MDIRQGLSALRASWWAPLVGMVIGAAAAFAFCLIQTPEYTSTTQLFVSATDSSSTSDAFQGSQFSQQRVASYARLITGEDVARRVINRLGLEYTPHQLASEVTASGVANTVLIDVSVTDTSPQRARNIAEAVGREFSSLVQELETPEGGGPSPVRVTVTDAPQLPQSPSYPQTIRDVVLGSVLGLIAGSLLAIARQRLDRSVRDASEASQLAGVPVIGTILRDEALIKRHTIDRGTASRTVEDYRQLRINLQFLNVDEPPRVIMISSAVPSEGKTTVVVNLSLALADAGSRVCIIEADLRRPKVTQYLGMVGDVGLTNVLAGSADIDDVTQNYRNDVSVIAAGPLPPNPGELLGSTQMASLIDKLRGQHDFVLVDAPPLLPVADSTALASAVDGILLSVRYGSTRKDQLAQAAAALARVSGRLMGVILNIVPAKADGAAAYGYGRSYGYDGKHAPGHDR